MKHTFNNILAGGVILLTAAACTGDYLDINSNQAQPGDLSADGFALVSSMSIVDPAAEGIGPVEDRGRPLRGERSEQHAIDRAPGVDPALGTGVLSRIAGRGGESHAVVL